MPKDAILIADGEEFSLGGNSYSGINFTPGDTMELSEDNILNVKLPNRGVITEEEYEQLTEEEKVLNVYVVSNGEDDPDSFGSENISLSDLDVWSTEERIVGDFFGKPIYEKSYRGDCGASGTSINFIEPNKYIIYANAFAEWSEGMAVMPLLWARLMSETDGIAFTALNKNSAGTWYINTDFIFKIDRYTGNLEFLTTINGKISVKVRYIDGPLPGYD